MSKAEVTTNLRGQGAGKVSPDIAKSSSRPATDRGSSHAVARNDAFQRFGIAIAASKEGEHCALLVDSEGPIAPNTTPSTYLRDRDGWNCPDLKNHPIFLMVQAMEAWFFADRAALAAFYGPDFRAKALRGDERDVEATYKDDLISRLVAATRATRAKGEYHKTRHAFEILASLEPNKVSEGSPYAAKFNAFLRSL